METMDTTGCRLEMENFTAIEIKDNVALVNSIGQMLQCLPPIPPRAERCICRVPRQLRQLNEKAYTPQMVSIGPLHHGESHLEDMEKQKMRYLEAFLAHARINLGDCVEMIKKWEERIRNCYAESIELTSDEFVKMVLLDSSFIIGSLVGIEALRLNYFVMLDLLLLENQLPFFVLEGLFVAAFASLSHSLPSFLELSIIFTVHNPDLKRIISSEVHHFIDLLRIYHLPSSQRSVPADSTTKFVRIQNAAALHKTGVKFKVGSSKCLLDIKYDNGVLEIPYFSIEDRTEQLLRNLIALECYLHSENSYIIDYILFMDGLIDGPEDVAILEKYGILENWLGDDSVVANLFNNLTTFVPMDDRNYYFYGLSNKLNSYCEVRWHHWKATLKRDYFSTPWRVFSIIVAALFLVLTFMQTICSLISL